MSGGYNSMCIALIIVAEKQNVNSYVLRKTINGQNR